MQIHRNASVAQVLRSAVIDVGMNLLKLLILTINTVAVATVAVFPFNRDVSIETLIAATMPGIKFNEYLLENSMDPWVLTNLGLSACLLYFLVNICLCRSAMSKVIWATLSLLSISSMISIFVALSVDRNPKDIITKFASVVAKYEKVGDGEKKSLVFIGQQHMADWKYYHSVAGFVRELARDGYVFYYEDTDAPSAQPGPGKKANMYWYDDGYFFRPYLDAIRQPYDWLGVPKAQWKPVDLDQNSSQIKSIDTGLPPEEWRERMQNERNAHLLKHIEESKEKKLAVLYGYNHFYALRDFIGLAGWVMDGSLMLLPEERGEPEY